MKVAAKEQQEVKKLERKDASEKKITVQHAQDSDDIGKFKGESTIGGEESFDKGVKKGFEPPKGNALMGEESEDLKINDKSDMPSIPRADANLEGEEEYKSDKSNAVDGNQGKSAKSSKKTKTASKCKCGKDDKDCEKCKKSCEAGNKQITKTAFVGPNHKLYSKLIQRFASGAKVVKLTDGNEYKISLDGKKNIILAKKIKESQQVSPKSVESLVDDPDINQTSGPGKGKVYQDKPHSLAVDEKKPSEGVNEPSVPEAPNGGRLSNETTVEKANKGPTIPAGGGQNAEYDKDEKNTPEKLDETLGKDTNTLASKNLAIKIAGQLYKAGKISIDEMPKTIDKLSQKSEDEILEFYGQSFKTASSQGLTKKASTDEVENLTVASNSTPKEEIGNAIQSLFRLDKQNKAYEVFSQNRETR